MGFFSKVFKGIKKVVKKVAKGIKKVGKAVWKGVKKVGKGLLKAVNKLGPVAMIAANFIPGVGTFFSSMWKTFGSTMGSWATSSNIVTKAIGTLGEAAYNGVNWIKGTANSITDGISKSFKSIGNGDFSKGVDQFANGFKNAATGQAGQAGVTAGQLDITPLRTEKALEGINLAQGTQTTADPFGTQITTEGLTQPIEIPTVDQFGTGTPTELFPEPSTPGITTGIRTAEHIAQPVDPSLSSVDPLARTGATETAEEFGERTSRRTLTDRLLGAAQAGFNALGQGQQQQQAYIPGYQADPISAQATAQIGSLGTGAAGGTFLSQEQVNSYNNYWNNSLGIGRRVGGTV